jgi:isopentenyl-diphosphate Delta-isomerase
MADELVDICDEKNNLTRLKRFKSEAHRLGLWHRTAHIWIYNSKGELLLQLRSKEKPLYPNMWDISAAGHVTAGEDPLISGLREIEEEIGLKVKSKDLQFFKIKKFSMIYKKLKNNEFCYVYFLKFDGDINKLKLQKEEVQKIRFLPLEKVKEELKKDPSKYTPQGGYWFETLDEIKKRLKK